MDMYLGTDLDKDLLKQTALSKGFIQSLANSRAGYHTKFEKKINTASILGKGGEDPVFSD